MKEKQKHGHAERCNKQSRKHKTMETAYIHLLMWELWQQPMYKYLRCVVDTNAVKNKRHTRSMGAV